MSKKKAKPEGEQKDVKQTKATRTDARNARMRARTQKLVDDHAHVGVRTKDGYESGIVQGLVDRPAGARRRGQYVAVLCPSGIVVRPRSRLSV